MVLRKHHQKANLPRTPELPKVAKASARSHSAQSNSAGRDSSRAGRHVGADTPSRTSQGKADRTRGISRSDKDAWHSDSEATRTAEDRSQPFKKSADSRLWDVGDLAGVSPAKFPSNLDVQLATLVRTPPDGDEWLNEVKFDGYRMLCRINRGEVEFVSRNHLPWTDELAQLVIEAKRFPAKQVILDGEVVVMRKDGTTDFQDLQNVFREGRLHELSYCVFDLLYLDGFDLREVMLEERKQLLARLMGRLGPSTFRYSGHIVGQGSEMFAQAARHGLEGIICKRRNSLYRAGRSYDWVKVKCIQSEEFVIGGFTEPEGARHGFGALLIGYYDGGSELLYAGKVGTGYSDQTLFDLRRRLDKIVQAESPFRRVTGRAASGRGVHWVQPVLCCQVAFTNWTRDGSLRHPSFLGLREDKSAQEVIRSIPMTISLPKSSDGANKKKPTKTAKKRKKPARRGKQPKPPIIATSEKDYRDSRISPTYFGVRLTSQDKILYPDDGITKLELAEYYVKFAAWILPHVSDRPLSLVRCPEGRKKECFFQKHPGVGTPENLGQIPIREKDTVRNYLLVTEPTQLISLAQIAALEVHVWGSRADELEKPDRMIFDLDPDPSVEWEQVVECAHEVRAFLTDIELESFVKTTGGKGLHIVVPIQRRHNWDEVKGFSEAVAKNLASRYPNRYTANMSKAARPGKIFVDYLRNGRGATAIAAYSTRARAGAPVSVPLSWDELTPDIRSNQFTIRNLEQRLTALDRDPWSELSTTRQTLTARVRRKVGAA